MTSRATDSKAVAAAATAPSSAEQPWNEQTLTAFNSKRYSEHYDPCQEAANRSIRCIHRNADNKDLCSDYFQAYRDCKKMWMEARKEAKRQERKERWSFLTGSETSGSSTS